MPPTCTQSHKMDTHTLHHNPPQPPAAKKSHRKRKHGGGRDESLKVVYISSPMKVRTSASRFRSLVQHLTGKNSDIGPYMDADGGALVDYRDEGGMLLPDHPSSVSNSDETTTTSVSGDVDNMFVAKIEDRFDGFFATTSFCDSSQMDVLGSYEDLMM